MCVAFYFFTAHTHTHTIIARAKWSAAAAAFIIHRRRERARKDDCVEQRARKCHFVAVVHLTAQLVCLLLHSTPSTTAGVNGELGWDSFLFVFGTALDVFSTAAQHRIREREWDLTDEPDTGNRTEGGFSFSSSFGFTVYFLLQAH